MIAIFKKNHLENTAETRFQDFKDYKFVPRTPQRLISNSPNDGTIPLLVFLIQNFLFTV
jgi:hypothetical protein